MKEEWKDIKGYEGLYRISNFGAVESKHHHGKWIRMKGTNNRRGERGYIQVFLYDESRKYKIFYVHRLVLLHFVGEPPEGKPFVLHLDDNSLNNRVDNLIWGSQVENGRHAAERGRMPRGEACKRSKLKEKDVILIRKELAKLKPHQCRGIQNICDKFGIDRSTVYAIKKQKSWSHVKETK